MLKDLEQAPQTLGRTAATAFKKFLADHLDKFSEAENALLSAWQKVLVGELEQTKAVVFAEQLLRKIEPKIAKPPLIKKIKLNNKVAGNIKFDQKQLKVSLNIEQLSDEDLTKLEELLQSFLEKPSEK